MKVAVNLRATAASAQFRATKRQRDEVLAAYDYRCALCGGALDLDAPRGDDEACEFDHDPPISAWTQREVDLWEMGDVLALLRPVHHSCHQELGRSYRPSVVSPRPAVTVSETEENGRVTITVPRSPLGIGIAVALGARHGMDIWRAQQHAYGGAPFHADEVRHASPQRARDCACGPGMGAVRHRCVAA